MLDMEQHTTFWYFTHNKVAMTTLLAWFVAQTIKVITGVLKEKRFNFKWFVGTGGMPSSHVAGVTALATCVGMQEGVGTAIFAVTLMFTIVVISDAQGVRWSTGKQAEILNKIMDDIYWKKRIQEDRLKELIGHTPIQVFAGIAVGLAVGLIAYMF
jgi:acid phosphatase family membrane protein YuiD